MKVTAAFLRELEERRSGTKRAKPRRRAKGERRPLERDVLAAIRARLALIPGVVLFRNNTGMLRDRRDTPVRYGLAVGSADLIGSVRVEALPLIGARKPSAIEFTTTRGPMTIARSLAIEVKRPGEKPTEAQVRWLAMVTAAGWIAGVCTSADEAVALVEAGRRWER